MVPMRKSMELGSSTKGLQSASWHEKLKQSVKLIASSAPRLYHGHRLLYQSETAMPAPLYRAPVSSMKFALAAFGKLEEAPSAPGPELMEAVLEEAARFANDVLSPLNAVGDRNPAKFNPVSGLVTTPPGFAEAYQRFVNNGWNAAGIAAEHGGQGLPPAAAAMVSEMWSGANMAFGLCPMLTQSAIDLLARHGTLEQQMHALPRLVTGEWTGTMCLTEAQAGSDVGAVATRAEPEGEHYRISGQKIYITFGEHDMAENILHLVLARLPDAPKGSKGISLFLVPTYDYDETAS